MGYTISEISQFPVTDLNHNIHGLPVITHDSTSIGVIGDRREYLQREHPTFREATSDAGIILVRYDGMISALVSRERLASSRASLPLHSWCTVQRRGYRRCWLKTCSYNAPGTRVASLSALDRDLVAIDCLFLVYDTLMQVDEFMVV